MASKDKQTSRDESIGKLIAAAGSGPTASAEARERVYSAVHRQWRETTAQSAVRPDSEAVSRDALAAGTDRGRAEVVPLRRRSTSVTTTARAWPSRTLAVAATVALAAIALTWFNAGRQLAGGSAELAQFAKIEGNVELLRDGDTSPLAPSITGVRVGDTLVTGGNGRAALRLSDDLMLRANVRSRIAFTSPSEIELLAGTIYIDSNGGNSALSVATPFGPIEHRGTQYELRLNDSTLRVRVREGAVAYGGPEEIVGQAGEQLMIDTSGLSSREAIAPDDADWDWVSALATLPPAEDYLVGDVLSWVARERGLVLRFEADAGTTARIAGRDLVGLDGLDPDGALDVAAAEGNFDYEIRDGELLISP